MARANNKAKAKAEPKAKKCKKIPYQGNKKLQAIQALKKIARLEDYYLKLWKEFIKKIKLDFPNANIQYPVDIIFEFGAKQLADVLRRLISGQEPNADDAGPSVSVVKPSAKKNSSNPKRPDDGADDRKKGKKCQEQKVPSKPKSKRKPYRNLDFVKLYIKPKLVVTSSPIKYSGPSTKACSGKNVSLPPLDSTDYSTAGSSVTSKKVGPPKAGPSKASIQLGRFKDQEPFLGFTSKEIESCDYYKLPKPIKLEGLIGDDSGKKAKFNSKNLVEVFVISEHEKLDIDLPKPSSGGYKKETQVEPHKYIFKPDVMPVRIIESRQQKPRNKHKFKQFGLFEFVSMEDGGKKT